MTTTRMKHALVCAAQLLRKTCETYCNVYSSERRMQPWSEHELVISHPPVHRAYLSSFRDAFWIETSQKTRLVRDFFKREWDSLSLKAAPLPWKVTMQPNILVATKSDAPTSPDIAPVTKSGARLSPKLYLFFILSLSLSDSLFLVFFLYVSFALYVFSFCNFLFLWFCESVTLCVVTIPVSFFLCVIFSFRYFFLRAFLWDILCVTFSSC